MKKLIVALFAGVMGLGALNVVQAQELPALEIYQAMLEANKSSGWVVFREYDGQQWIYFTPLVTMHCRLEEVRYSINSDALDQSFALPRCNPSLPFSLPDGAGPDTIAIVLPPESAGTLSVQVSFTGGKKVSNILTFRPCKDAGERACAVLVSEVPGA